jgi:type 1 glutamine amidotransferase
MTQKNALLVLGGTWHKFDEFAAALAPMLPDYRFETTRDLGTLQDLASARYDLVVMYTCLSAGREDGTPAETLFSDADAAPLATWVAAGGALLMVHSACVACQSSPALRRLAGGVFLHHPPAFTFTVHPMHHEHPIIDGVSAFSVHDEFYIEIAEPDVLVHMVALDRGIAYPMVWSRTEGQGRVANIAMGHDERVWDLAPYQRLMRQAAAWAMAEA